MAMLIRSFLFLPEPGAFPVNSGSPEMLQIPIFTALSDAEATSLRLEMLVL
ncbi:hypothetical protein [Shinella oryzae]|uniref:Uncharacterized protein n=1 Tax=Shinella oryzae TaxID=2871820 RepID=A0ABY9K371_9HYPH|nr:hypothetical protein [Shinella oryzae]WLS02951.1 hypothetical protein Q9315_16290 [Shinella oryzae]